MVAEPFWKTKALEEMNQNEWESLCDGCGRCCLNKLEDEDTGEIIWTSVACRLLDDNSCQCKDYPNRSKKVADCVQLTPQTVRTITWLPPTCAYQRLAEGKDLNWWHPLISKDPATVHTAGISVQNHTVVSEENVDVEDFEDYLTNWPLSEENTK